MSSITKNQVSTVDSQALSGGNLASARTARFLLPGNALMAFLAIPMLIALGISAYLTYVTATASEVVGCSGGELFDCGHVIYSKWSKFLGFPVSSLALVTYVAMIAALCVTATKRFSIAARQWAWTAVTGLAIAAAFSAIYFTILQVFVLKHLCPWCLGAHSCGLVIAMVVLFARPLNRGRMAAVVTLAASGLLVMMAAQINATEPVKYEVIEFPIAESEEPIETIDETFTHSLVGPPSDGVEGDDAGLFSAPAEDDSLFAPPTEDDDLFAPPSEDDDLFEAPTDDDSASSGSIVQPWPARAYATTLVFAPRSSVAMLSFIQIPDESKTADSTEDSAEKALDAAVETALANLKERAAKEATAKAKAKAKTARRIVSTMGGRLKLAAQDWPLDGQPEATHVFIEMFDYTCPHCRSTSKAVFEAKEKLGNDVAVLLLPVPLCSACNPNVAKDHPMHLEACELAELSVAVWRCDKELFSDFHRWMFEGETAPTIATARTKALEMVGKEKLETELAKSVSKAYVQKNVQIYKRVGAGQVPKLLFPSTMVQGEFTAADALVDLIKAQTGAPAAK